MLKFIINEPDSLTSPKRVGFIALYSVKMPSVAVYGLGYRMSDEGIDVRPTRIEALRALHITDICTTNSQWVVRTLDGMVFEQARRETRFHRVHIPTAGCRAGYVRHKLYPSSCWKLCRVTSIISYCVLAYARACSF